MAAVSFAKATREFPGMPHPAVNSLDLDIADGEFLVLVGPSGCGKSTSLRMLAGLEPVDSGEIYIGGNDVTNVAPKDRDVAMVFQNYALYPHMTAYQNMAFALVLHKVPRPDIDRRVREAAKLLDIDQSLLARKPKALSGGQRQRIAMGRAIVREPQVFLMDEPLSNLDAKLRVATRAQIAALQRRLGTTTVYVTHDQVEAMTMGHRVAVLHDGVLQQVDTPRELYERPANVFVAGFIGSPSMNLHTVALTDMGGRLGGQTISLTREQVTAARAEGGGDRVIVGVRPEHLDLVSDGDSTTLAIVIDLVEELGSDAYIHGHLVGDLGSDLFVARVDGRTTVNIGETVHLRPRPGAAHVFHAATGVRL